jgi:hypothetical protein
MASQHSQSFCIHVKARLQPEMYRVSRIDGAGSLCCKKSGPRIQLLQYRSQQGVCQYATFARSILTQYLDERAPSEPPSISSCAVSLTIAVPFEVAVPPVVLFDWTFQALCGNCQYITVLLSNPGFLCTLLRSPGDVGRERGASITVICKISYQR